MCKKLLLFFLLLAFVISLFLFIQGKIWLVNPDRSKYPIRGIDVSHYQGDIDWQAVSKDDVGFAYIKATEANDLRDAKFMFNWNNAIKNNIPTGAYHFYSLAHSGKIQAENFIKTVPLDKYQLPPVVDLEYVGNSKKRPPKEEFVNGLRIYLRVISSHYNKQPILYTTYEFYEDYLYPEFEKEKIWIRDIFSKPDTKKIGDWEIWQYNPRGSIDGIKGNVDLNVFNGTNL
ncbi:MAG: hypothetical protein A2571_01565 [Candidatus Vogelbacteria bacterium RIFOXYD1_FULL_44_32]|uniref:Lysozyme n=1 Tax=Candidatus Vogelbacteria bacterium RIFOXYD1_FULL_44_32 TaxID=1802438 RepID=A0A1G2QEF0_9BACT|nr:MAG: hypothetical protein A2571_01565 [Candidatus Vogelbacteria bacterium RIFOXYD1_FULL_44_32]